MSKVILKADVQEFKPVTLEVTIESAEELAFLWGLFNISQNDAVESISKDYPILVELGQRQSNFKLSMELFTAVNDLAIKLGLREDY